MMASLASRFRFSSVRSWATGACVVVALGSARPAEALNIDSFDSGEDFVLESVGGWAWVELTQPAQALGGTRELRTFGRVAFDPSSGLDLFESWVELTYRIPETDLTANGEDRFLITFGETLFPADWLYVHILVTTPGVDGGPPFCRDGGCYDGGLITTYGRAEVAPPTGPFELALFPDFGLLVMAHAVEIKLSIYGYREDQADFNVRLVDFRTIPEPPTALLGAISALVLLAGRSLPSKLAALLA